MGLFALANVIVINFWLPKPKAVEMTISSNDSQAGDQEAAAEIHHIRVPPSEKQTALGELVAAPIQPDMAISWSTFPKTQFTDHVLDIVTNLNLANLKSCSFVFDFIVPNNTSSAAPPEIHCPKMEQMWCSWFSHTFQNRSIPHNVSLAIVTSDSFQPKNGENACLGNSSPNGKFAIPNTEEIGHHLFRLTRGTELKWNYQDDVPWENRSTIPVFRGSPRGYQFEPYCHRNPNVSYAELLNTVKGRYFAVDFSVENPHLLDARFHTVPKSGCFLHQETNGLSKLLPTNSIKEKDYYSRHQVVLVLGGAGAAFRTARHLMTRTAIVMQAFKFEEWFTQYMKPFVHYIPLAEDLHDLNETMYWIAEHPDQVREIADNGRKFYETYLTFPMNADHMYELVFRLSEYRYATKQGKLPVR